MADLEKTVSIIFSGKDELSGKLKGISRSVDQFSTNIQSATQPLADLAKNILKIEAALVTLATGGLAYAVNKASDFQASFSEISTLIDGTGEDFKRFKGEILDYATNSTASIGSITAAVYTAISAGTKYEKSLESLAVAEKLSVAGKADLNDTTKALAGTLNAYGAATSEAGDYADDFFTTVKLGQTTIPELAQSLSNVTGIAKEAGVPFATLTSAIAALTAANVPTAQAITGIKAAIGNIIIPSGKAAEAAKALGISFDAAALKSEGFEGVLKKVYTATGGNVGQMGMFFGSLEGLNTALVLGADSLGKFDGALEAMKNNTGAVSEAYEKMVYDLNLAIQTLKNNFEAVMIDIGTPLLDETADIANALSEIFKGIRIGINKGAFDDVFKALEKFGSAVAKDLKKIAEIMPEALNKVDFDGLVKAFGGLGEAVKEAFAALFGDVDLTTADGLSKAIQKIVDAFTALTNIAAGIVDMWEPVISGMSKAIDTFSTMDDKTHSLIGKLLGLAQVTNTLAPVLGVVSGGLGAVASTLTSLAAVRYLIIGGGMKAIAVGIGQIVLALAPFAIGGGIIIGLLYILDKLAELQVGEPKVFKATVKIDGGKNLNLDTGIVTDNQGNIVSIPYEWKEKEPPKSSSVLMQELLDEGRTKAEIEYVLKPNMENLDAAVRSLGVGIKGNFTEPVSDTLDLLTDLPKKIEPLELIKIDKSLIETELKEIETKADIVQTALEWTAQLDIAEVEAASRVMEAAFEASAVTVEALAASTADMVATLGGVDTSKGFGQYWDIKEFAEAQQKMEQSAVDTQNKLTTAQIALLEAQTEARKRGDALVTINGEGLQPHLEAFMWEILEAIQIRASETGVEYLLGVNA